MNRPEELMDEFERELVQRMRRVDPPEGFALRVMERAEIPPKVLVMPKFRMSPMVRTWVGGAIAAALAVGVFVGEQAHIRQQREKQAMAQQQFETAMRVTDRALDQTRAQLERAGFKFGD